MTTSAPSATWVPKEKQTATWRVFHKKWLVRVPVFQSRSIEDVEHFGVFTSGERDYDAAMMNERRLQYMSIDEMYELYKRDITVGIFNVKEAADIYNDVSEHLLMWQNNLWGSSNIKAHPDVLEDLIGLDRFANALWPHAQPILKEDFIESDLFKAFNLFDLPMAAQEIAPAKVPSRDEPYVLPPRDSFEDIFAKRRRVKTSWNGE